MIVTLDAVEKAYIRDSITEAEYTESFNKLLKQYKTILSDETVSNEFIDLEHFKRAWSVRKKQAKSSKANRQRASRRLTGMQIECPRATERLRIGIPATVEQTSHNQASAPAGGAAGSAISDATENFITFLDALKINMFAKDTLHPLLADVISSVNKVTDGDFEGRAKIIQWLIVLNQMKANEEISPEQARELSFDMERAYYGFKATLK